jgi:ATP phosphoribosyltransferase regulatory subunit
MRPDLTVPTCRLHIARNGSAGLPARYCYNGPAYRYQPQEADESHPREFRQAGIELFGGADAEAAETEVLALICDGLRAVGLTSFEIRIGDLGLFNALLDRLHMPERWHRRLSHQFWRPDAFRAELHRLSSARPPLPPVLAAAPQFVAALQADPSCAAATTAQFLDDQGIELIGARTPREIAETLLDAIADARAEPLSPAAVRLIESYLKITGSARQAAVSLAALASGDAPELDAAIARYRRRLDLMAAAGVPVEHMTFSAEFGRNLEYYTGLVFEVVAPGLGAASPIAGGGRYDKLMRAVGATGDVLAVGSAIHTERLLQAVSEVNA